MGIFIYMIENIRKFVHKKTPNSRICTDICIQVPKSWCQKTFKVVKVKLITIEETALQSHCHCHLTDVSLSLTALLSLASMQSLITYTLFFSGSHALQTQLLLMYFIWLPSFISNIPPCCYMWQKVHLVNYFTFSLTLTYYFGGICTLLV